MITCELGDKTYTVDFIAGRALREMGPALKVYSQIAKALAGEEEAAEKPIELADGLDVLVKWFCLIFGNQFTLLVAVDPLVSVAYGCHKLAGMIEYLHQAV